MDRCWVPYNSIFPSFFQHKYIYRNIVFKILYPTLRDDQERDDQPRKTLVGRVKVIFGKLWKLYHNDVLFWTYVSIFYISYCLKHIQFQSHFSIWHIYIYIDLNLRYSIDIVSWDMFVCIYIYIFFSRKTYFQNNCIF